jgi:hypothetical protein
MLNPGLAVVYFNHNNIELTFMFICSQLRERLLATAESRIYAVRFFSLGQSAAFWKDTLSYNSSVVS